VEKLFHRPYGVGDGRRDRWRQRHARGDVARFARDDYRPLGPCIELVEQREHVVGRESVRVDDRSRRRDGVRTDLDDRDRAGRLTVGRRVHQDQQLASVEKFVGEVDTPNADVGELYAGRHRSIGKVLGHLDAETVVAQKYVADAGDEDAIAVVHVGSTSSGVK
jgi:hypothetical protein